MICFDQHLGHPPEFSSPLIEFGIQTNPPYRCFSHGKLWTYLLRVTPKYIRKVNHLRILGIDFGEKRIGVAISDELGLTAQGVSTIIRKNNQVMEELKQVINRYQAERIVIGYPLRLDGSAGIQCDKINHFGRYLETAFGLPVILWDETLSTKEAEGILREADIHWKKRRQVVDKLAATLILQGYLDHLSRNT
jgi:putative Holliday junction resolvase